MKALKIILAVLGGFVVLVVIAAVIFIRTFDPNSLKDDLTAFVHERTGRTLAIEDSIELSLFPWFAVETGGVSLSDDPAFGERELIRIDELSARIQVWPLLKRRVEIGRVVFDGINLNLGVDADGRGNWASLLERYSDDSADGNTAAEPVTGKPTFKQLAVEGIELRNARVLWHDASGEVAWLVRDLDLKTGAIRDDAPVELSLALNLLDVGSQLMLEVDLETVAQLTPEPRLTRTAAALRVLDAREEERVRADLAIDSISLTDSILRVAPLQLTAHLNRPPVGPESLQAQITLAALELDTASETLAIDGLTTRTGPVSADWSLRGDSVFSAPRLNGSIAARADSLAALLTTLGIEASTDLSASTDPVTMNTDFALELEPQSLALNNLRLNALGIPANGEARLAADGTLAGRLTVPAFRLTGPALANLQAIVPAGIALSDIGSASARTDFSLNSDRNALEVSGIAVTLDAASLGGHVLLSGPADQRQASGTLTLTGLDNSLLAALATDVLPISLLEADLGPFRLAADFRYGFATQIAELNPMQLSAYGLSGDGQITIRQASGDLAISGQARLAEFSPRTLLTRFNQPVPQSADPTALGSARLAASFETTGNDGRFRDLVIDLDDSRITGEFSVEDFANPAYRFVLRADQVDVDRYLPPAGARAAGEVPDERKLGDIELASEPLTATVIQGSASVGTLVIGGMQYEQLSARLDVGDGRASLSDVQTRLYGGEFAGGVEVDAAAGAPSIHLTGTATSVAIKPLLTAMLGGAYISGTGNFTLDLTGTGNSIGAAMNTAAGTMSLTLNNGVLEGINAGRSLCAAMNQLNGLPAPEQAPNTTAYTQIRGTATVSDGIASSSDLSAATSFLNMTGRANLRLVDQQLSSKFVARMAGPINLRGCERVNSRIDTSIPFGFTLDGKLPNVDYGFDVAELVKDLAQREIQNRIRDSVLDRLLN